ncbi:hypothetical protein CR513_15556, partial [Mucuna pruriens]
MAWNKQFMDLWEHAKQHLKVLGGEAAFWEDRYMKNKHRTLLQHPYETHAKTKLMEVVVDNFEQQHKELKEDVNQLKA